MSASGVALIGKGRALNKAGTIGARRHSILIDQRLNLKWPVPRADGSFPAEPAGA